MDNGKIKPEKSIIIHKEDDRNCSNFFVSWNLALSILSDGVVVVRVFHTVTQRNFS